MNRGRVVRAALVAVCGTTAMACSSAGEVPSTIPTEPMVTSSQFIPGALPGAAPLADGGLSTEALQVTQASVPVLPIVAGASNESLSGLVTEDAVAVGVALQDPATTGYWVTPVGSPDPLFPGQISFGFTANFNASDAPGVHQLLFVAVDSTGRGGTQFEAPVCIQNVIPDNGHACNPAKSPPSAVISLNWDTNFDLDLHVIDPNGVDLNPQHPADVPADAGSGKLPTCTPTIDRDSLEGCAPDGIRREDLVFQCAPQPGVYHLYVDPFASCGVAAVHFTLTVYTLVGTCPSCGLSPVYAKSGELLSLQVTGGATPGLFVHDQTF